jgi:hypothetical protein
MRRVSTLPAPRLQLAAAAQQLKLSISDKGSWRCSVNLSSMRTISRYNNNGIPLTSSSTAHEQFDRDSFVLVCFDDLVPMAHSCRAVST